MSDDTPAPGSLTHTRRSRAAAARLSTPDWVFSSVIHLLLVLLLVTSKAGPGGGFGGGPGSRREGGSGDSEFPGEGWVEMQMGVASDAPRQAALNPGIIKIAPLSHLPAVAPLEANAETADEKVETAVQQAGFDRPEERSPLLPADVRPVPAVHSSSTGASASGGSGGGRGQASGSGAVGDGSLAEGGEGQGGTSLFGIWDRGQRIVYVIDRSGSMQDFGKFIAARNELESSLGRLDPSVEFQVLFYNQQVQTLSVRGSPGLSRATGTNRNQILAQSKVVLPDGGTQHRTALQAALRLQPTVVYFLTDAEDPGLTADEIDAITRKLKGATRIHCIQFGEISGEVPTAGNWLQQLAGATGGKYVHLRSDAFRHAGGESRMTH